MENKLFKISEGWDHYNNVPLYRVDSTADNDNEYVGEWTKDRKIAEEELEELIASHKAKFTKGTTGYEDLYGKEVVYLYNAIDNYRNKLENMSDDELADEYVYEVGVSKEDVLSDIEEERDEYISELMHRFRQTMKSRGEEYGRGGILNEDQENDFQEWMKDGNVHKFPDGYSTQDAQWRNRLKTLNDLRRYFYNEFIKGTSDDYAVGGKTKKFKVEGYVYDGGKVFEQTYDNFNKAFEKAQEIEDGWSDDGTYYAVTIFKGSKKIKKIQTDRELIELYEDKLFSNLNLDAYSSKERKTINEKLKDYTFNVEVKIASYPKNISIFNKNFETIFDVFKIVQKFYEGKYYTFVNNKDLSYWYEKIEEEEKQKYLEKSKKKKIVKANVGLLLAGASLLNQRRQQNQNRRSRWEDRGLDYRQPQYYYPAPQPQPIQPIQPQNPLGQVDQQQLINALMMSKGKFETGGMPNINDNVSTGFTHYYSNNSLDEAKKVADDLKHKHPNWQVIVTTIDETKYYVMVRVPVEFGKRVYGRGGFPTGRAWTREHYHDNDDEDYEVDPSKRKVRARNRKYAGGGFTPNGYVTIIFNDKPHHFSAEYIDGQIEDIDLSSGDYAKELYDYVEKQFDEWLEDAPKEYQEMYFGVWDEPATLSKSGAIDQAYDFMYEDLVEKVKYGKKAVLNLDQNESNITEAFEYKKGGFLFKSFEDFGNWFLGQSRSYPTGRAWSKEHYNDNDDEDYEVDPSKRKVKARNRRYDLGGDIEGRLRGYESRKNKEFYDYILSGNNYSLEDAKDVARGLDWSEIETSEQDIPYLDYKDTVNGIDIYYNYGSDDYYFADNTKYARGGYPEGRAWTREHYHDNDDEDYEVDPNKRKVRARNRKYAGGGKTEERFIILSPDGFPLYRDKTFTKDEILPAFEEWKKRYEQQGYYSTSNRERIPLDEIGDYCSIIDADTWMFETGGKLIGDQYKIDMNKNGRIDAEDFEILRNSMNGAWRNEHKHVNHSEDWETKYARKTNSSRTGYKGRKEYAVGGKLDANDFADIKKGDIVKISFSSPIQKSNEVTLKVQSKSTVGKGKKYEKEKITFFNVNNPDGVRYYAYLDKDGYLGMAFGDLAIWNVQLLEKRNPNDFKYAGGGLSGKGSRAKNQYNKEVDAYKWFVVSDKKDVDSGWEYKNDATDQAKELNEDEYKGCKWKVMSLVTLKKQGIADPRENWKYKHSLGGFLLGTGVGAVLGNEVAKSGVKATASKIGKGASNLKDKVKAEYTDFRKASKKKK